MSRNAKNNLLKQAKKGKNDEFYTQLVDIERELKYYKTKFENKVIYCNCDNPNNSNFFKYFESNFNDLKIKKLISSCYNPNGQGFYIEYTGHLKNIKYFNGDGDFRSLESIELLKQSDIVITNPPFSLFREFVLQLIEFNKEFLIIGNINAITYKEIFKLIKDTKVWLGINLGRGISGFIVPEKYELYGTEAYINNYGTKIISTNNCLWLTNLDYSKRHDDIILTKQYYGNENNYLKYDNFDAINVNKTKDIPADYNGYIGVPITFLHKFNPEQFDIIKFRKGDDNKDLSINGKYPYFRIIIKNKKLY
jgi:hypothetical protein